MAYYTDFIQSKDEWEFAGLYADEAVSGTTVDKRDDFQRLLADCRAGKIDRILVKSISRFARNTLDCLQTVRELKQLGVAVEFEKEGIDTGNMGSEMLLSILGSAAQEESLSISKNLKWSYRRRMKSGDFITSKDLLGYFFKNNTLVPNPKEVPIVEYIFNSYLSGKGTDEIADELNVANLKTNKKPSGRWHSTMIRYILSNEKYIGDSLVQKRYTPEDLPLRQKRNNGELSQYYIQNSHPAIISRETFEAVQQLLNRRRKRHPPSVEMQQTPLRSTIRCALCGSYFHKHKSNGENCWFCALHRKSKDLCPMPNIREQEILMAFLSMYNKLLDNIDMSCHNTEVVGRNPTTNNSLSIQAARLTNEINQAMNQREVDPNELLPLILECAAEKYKTCSIKEADHLTITLKALFQAHSNDTTLDRELFERAVKQVILQPDASVQLRLLNDIVV